MRMAKNAKAVADFLSELSTKLEPLLQDELKVLLQLKKEEVYLQSMLFVQFPYQYFVDLSISVQCVNSIVTSKVTSCQFSVQ